MSSLPTMPRVMGILNVTPDSFYDKSRAQKLDDALYACDQMITDGVDIIDVGGESSRPGAEPVSLEQELERVLPILEAIHQRMDVELSVDTYKPQVMKEALGIGVDWINDIRALQEPKALEVVADSKANVCLMHMQNDPTTMQKNPNYHDVVCEVKSFLAERVKACVEAGIELSRINVDPGFGFGKSLEHNLFMLKHLGEFQVLGCGVLVGLSRKSMFKFLLGLECEDRLAATLAGTALAVAKGASVIRTHDVKATKECVQMAYYTEFGLEGHKP